jgi:hypothetical protein
MSRRDYDPAAEGAGPEPFKADGFQETSTVGGSSMFRSMHCGAGDANESQNGKQKQFGRIVHQAVEDIDIYRAPRDQKTRVLGRCYDYQSVCNQRSSHRG